MTESVEKALEELDAGVLLDELWQTAVEAASPAEFGLRCGRLVRAWNALAVGRMDTKLSKSSGKKFDKESTEQQVSIF